MSRIPKELRIYVEDAYHSRPTGKRPKDVRVGAKGSRWGLYERNRLLAYEAWTKAGSPVYGKLPVSVWITMLSFRRSNLLRVPFWYEALLGSYLGGLVIGFSARLRIVPWRGEDRLTEGVEILIRREDVG